MLWVAVATEHGRYSLSCMQIETVSSAGSVLYVASYVIMVVKFSCC